MKLEPCPFCNNTKLNISDKKHKSYKYHNHNVAVFCENCYSYGPRVIYKPKVDLVLKSEIIKTKEYQNAEKKAIKLWNMRKNAK